MVVTLTYIYIPFMLMPMYTALEKVPKSMIAAIQNSLYVATSATCITVVLGTTAALALDRVKLPGMSVFRRMIRLPLALPGIVTGISMLNLFRVMGFDLSLETVILGHATALIAIVVTQVCLTSAPMGQI